jgi:hypothetical protein
MLLIFFVPAFLGRKKNKRKKKQTLGYTYKPRGRERDRKGTEPLPKSFAPAGV